MLSYKMFTVICEKTYITYSKHVLFDLVVLNV